MMRPNSRAHSTRKVPSVKKVTIPEPLIPEPLRAPRVLPRVLVVDDLSRDLPQLAKQLAQTVKLELTFSAEEAEAKLGRESFDVLVIALKLAPRTVTEALVAHARRQAPAMRCIGLAPSDSLREAATLSAREGWFRLLPPLGSVEELRAAVDDAIAAEQELIAARRVQSVALDQIVTLMGELLASSAPHLFARGMRLHRRAAAAMKHQPEHLAWPVRSAAFLSQLGLTLVPPSVGEKLSHGEILSPQELEQLERVPELSARLIAPVAGLEGVAEIVRRQREPLAKDPPLGARILHAVAELDLLEARGVALQVALAKLRARAEAFDADVVTLLAQGEDVLVPKKVRVAELERGMILGEDVRAAAGLLIAGRGAAISPGLLARIQTFHARQALRQPIEVLVTGEAPPALAPGARPAVLRGSGGAPPRVLVSTT
jgi:hypothetical protein